MTTVHNLFAGIVLKDGRLRPVLRILIYAVAVFFVWLFTVVMIANVYALFAGPIAAFDETPDWIVYTGLLVATVGVAIFFRANIDRRSVGSLGLTLKTAWGKLFVLGVALGAGMQLLVFALELGFGGLRVDRLSLSGTTGWAVASTAVVFLIASISEEMPLRGYVLQNLWEEAGFWPAAIVTSLLFAFIHMANPHFGEHPWISALNIMADGLWACVSVLWTRSLWLAWGQHFAWNLFEGPVLGAPVSGLATAAFVVRNDSGSGVMTGGSFGPEGGLVASIALAAGLVVLYWLNRRGAFAQLPDTREAYQKRSPS